MPFSSSIQNREQARIAESELTTREPSRWRPFTKRRNSKWNLLEYFSRWGGGTQRKGQIRYEGGQSQRHSTQLFVFRERFLSLFFSVPSLPQLPTLKMWSCSFPDKSGQPICSPWFAKSARGNNPALIVCTGMDRGKTYSFWESLEYTRTQLLFTKRYKRKTITLNTTNLTTINLI